MQRVFVLAAEADLSLNETLERLSEALRAQFGCDENGYPRFYIQEAFGDYVIARAFGGEGLYRIPYTIASDAVTFGSAQEVETAYVPIASECEFVAGEADGDDDGAFPISIIKPGWATGALGGNSVPHYYTPEFCAQIAAEADKIPFGRYHPDQKGPDPTGALDADRIAGFVDAPKWDGSSAKGVVRLFAAEATLRSRLSEARKTGTLKNFAVSMLAHVAGVPGKVEGKDALVINRLGKLYSVDLCARAGAGGQFLAAASTMGGDIAAAQLAAVKPNSTAIAPSPGPGHQPRLRVAAKGAFTMDKKLKQLLDALAKKDPAKSAGFYSRAVLASEAEQETIYNEAMTALGEAPAANSQTVLATEAATTALATLNRAQSRGRIEAKLAESKLGKPAQELVRSHLEVVLATEAELADDKIDAEIGKVRTAFAAFENVGRVQIAGVAMDTRDKLVLATEAMIGVKEAKGKGVPAFRGIREAYVTITGDRDLSALTRGGFVGHVLASEAVATGDFPNILLDAMHKMLAQEYAENDEGLSAIYQTASLDDYRLRNVVRDGYFGEAPIVAEGGTYLEIAKPTDEKVSYAPAKRGGILTISEETIRNDDLGAIARWPGKLARRGRNTLRSFVVNFLAANTTYAADGLTIFHASHNNLGTDVFGLQGLRNARLALRRQQEKDSLEYLGFPLTWIAVPPELESAAKQINQTDTAGSSDFYHAFGDNNERILVVERFTDTNDWYYGTDSGHAPFMEIGFLDGKQQPEIFLANQPTVGTQFTADQLQYKDKFTFGGAVIDFRGVGKNVNA